jgi:hypothetical protein
MVLTLLATSVPDPDFKPITIYEHARWRSHCASMDSFYTQVETGGRMNAFLSGLFVARDTSPRLVQTHDASAYPADSTTVFFR